MRLFRPQWQASCANQIGGRDNLDFEKRFCFCSLKDLRCLRTYGNKKSWSKTSDVNVVEKMYWAVETVLEKLRKLDATSPVEAIEWLLLVVVEFTYVVLCDDIYQDGLNICMSPDQPA
ncbi:hypothetical protein NDU88_004463 [Pleurodeles waltl]|uniref:Uncharacterized protein n=1 Tax=Pleurodeles waltl TaxID=8319 RepID=A0AAV7UIA6_PLEWA|nr:hypothetical protein NDU88_004463 [Pleurodeles waltl]